MSQTQPHIPPQAIEAEQSILGAALQNDEALKTALSMLTPKHFYLPKHQKIFSAILVIHQRGDKVDLLTVPARLVETREIVEVGGRRYLMDLTDTVVNFDNVDNHCRIITEAASKNAIIDFCSETINNCYDPSCLAKPTLEEMESAIKRIRNLRIENLPIRTGKDMAETLMEGMDTAKTTHLLGLRTGFEYLDRLLLGLQPGYLITVAGRPSMGKTAMAMNFANNICIKQKTPGLFISLEMGELSLVQRFASLIGGVSSYRFRRGELHDDEIVRVGEIAGMLSESPLTLADMAIASLGQISRLVDHCVEELGTRIVFLDYLQLVRLRGRSRNEEVGDITAELKRLARMYDITIVVLSQLSRAAEDVIPNLSHLRESGNIEQDSDQVIFLFRKRDPAGELERSGKIIIGKARNERTGIIDFQFEGRYMRFITTETKYEEDGPNVG